MRLNCLVLRFCVKQIETPATRPSGDELERKRKKKELKIERLRIKRSFRRRVNNALLSLGKFNGKEKLLRRKRASKDDER